MAWFVSIALSVALVEMVMMGLWLRPYYRCGVVVYERAIHGCSAPLASIDPGALSREFRSWTLPSIVFVRFGPDQIGFRERFVEIRLFNYLVAMRGIITHDPAARTVTVSGRLDLVPIVFWAFWLALSGSLFEETGALWFALLWGALPLVLLAVSYRIQRKRYNKIVAWLKPRLTGGQADIKAPE